MIKENKIRFKVTIYKETYEMIKEVAKEQNISVSALTRNAIITYTLTQLIKKGLQNE